MPIPHVSVLYDDEAKVIGVVTRLLVQIQDVDKEIFPAALKQSSHVLRTDQHCGVFVWRFIPLTQMRLEQKLLTTIQG